MDPFAGGGAIPLEAQRLGLEAHAHDLNPVAVMINKAMIEITPKFADMPPVNPDDRINRADSTWKGAQGLAADIRYYGTWMKEEAFRRIGHMYPKVNVPKEQGGGEVVVIAWIWARYTTCPNPACGCEIPLVSSYILSKKGNIAWAEPVVKDKKLSFVVHQGKCPKGKETSKVGRAAVFRCPVCGETTSDSYIKKMGIEHNIREKLMAIVGEAKGKKRIYIDPSISPYVCETSQNIDPLQGAISLNPRWFSPPSSGLFEFHELYTKRQLLALTTFSDLVSVVIAKVENDAIQAGVKNDFISLDSGGNNAKAYGEAIGVCLTFALDKAANLWSSLVGWMNDRGAFRETFSRQAMPMVWDFAEANPFSTSAGNFLMFVERCADAIQYLPINVQPGFANQYDAQSNCGLKDVMVSTDPPYYDNIGYADLSDCFYVWMRRCLQPYFPKLFSTMLVPKSDELIATPVRHDGSVEKAKQHFENGMTEACRMIYPELFIAVDHKQCFS